MGLTGHVACSHRTRIANLEAMLLDLLQSWPSIMLERLAFFEKDVARTRHSGVVHVYLPPKMRVLVRVGRRDIRVYDVAIVSL
jgi:hypothetical protein